MNYVSQESVRPSLALKGLLELALSRTEGSLTKLAKEIGVRAVTVSLWYRANAQPNQDSIKRIEDFVFGQEISLGQED